MASGGLDAERVDPAGDAKPVTGRRRAAVKLRLDEGFAGPARPSRPAVRGGGAGDATRPNPSHRLRNAGDRPDLPLPAAAGRYRPSGRSLLLQLSGLAARPSREGRRGPDDTRRAGPSVVRTGPGEPSTAPLRHELGHPQPDWGITVSPGGAPNPDHGRGLRRHHRRGRHLRRLRTRAVAAPRRSRWSVPRHPHRQLLQDAVGLDPLRLHRGAGRLDRGLDRPSGGDELRRAEPDRRRDRPGTAAIASIWRACAPGSPSAGGR